MEYWKHCWNCDHDSLQERKALEFFPRIVEMFNKQDSGKVNQRVWVVYFDSFSFTKCKKCEAPSLFIDEYWTTSATPEESKKEAGIIAEEIKVSGESESGELVNSLCYPGFSKKPFPQWTHDLEESYMVLFWEVYQALSLGLNTLAMMGVRAIVDKFATDKVGDIGGFSKKLRKLLSEGHINNEQHSLLNVIVDVGNASAHRGFKPKKEDVSNCMQVIEHLVSIERFGEPIEKIKNNTPKRFNNK
jgi:hypothetical protein